MYDARTVRTTIHVYDGRAAAKLADAIRAVEPSRAVVPLGDAQTLVAALPEVQVLFTVQPPRTGWKPARRLRLIQLLGVGAESLLPSPDLPAHVQVAGVRGVFAAETAEFAIASMLALARDFARIEAQRSERLFRQFPGDRLAGRTAAVLGLGAIGGRVARVCHALEMRVLGVSRTGRATDALAPFLEVVDSSRLDEVLAVSDYVVVTLPRTPATEGLLDRRRLALLPRGARVVVVARGGIVDEAALVDALEDGHLAGAALDVFADEPLGADHPLWGTRGLRISPHLAGLGHRYVEQCVEVLLDNVARLERGAPPVRTIDRSAGY